MLSAIRSRWGQRLGQKKQQVSYWAKKCGKSPDFARNQDFLARGNNSNPLRLFAILLEKYPIDRLAGGAFAL